MTTKQRLILFTRYPVAGRTKTRLIPALGARGAAQIQQRMTELIAEHALQLNDTLGVEPFIYYCGGSDKQVASWLGPAFTYRPQSSGDIGQRMAAAFSENFIRGVSKIVLVGSDIPGLTSQLIAKAFAVLDSNDTVIGPAVDGGYYLIGIHDRVQERLLPHIFSGILWSTETVFKETIAILLKRDISYTILPELHDIDRPSDLAKAPNLLQP